MRLLQPFATLLIGALLSTKPLLAADLILGGPVDLKKKLSVEEILKNPETYNDKEVTIGGKIVAVCAKRGCWMQLSPEKGSEQIKIKVEDGNIVIPVNARGKSGTAVEKFSIRKLNRNQTEAYYRHEAEETGKKFDRSTIKEDLTLYQVDATGIIIH